MTCRLIPQWRSVVELTSIGVSTRNVTRFLVLNPTSSSYEFVWEAQVRLHMMA